MQLEVSWLIFFLFNKNVYKKSFLEEGGDSSFYNQLTYCMHYKDPIEWTDKLCFLVDLETYKHEAIFRFDLTQQLL